MPRRNSVHMLWIGNSFTARNDLPGLVAALADATGGPAIRHDLVSAGGASLRRHWNAGHAQRRIRRGHVDYVVLQEQSTLPIKNPDRFHENVRAFAPLVEAAGARLVLYETWARRAAPQSQDLLSKAYRRIGRETGARVVRAGAAWRAFLKRHAVPALHDRDGSHPTLAGSYLAACCFDVTLFDGDPRAAAGTGPGLEETDRRRLAAVARRVCRDPRTRKP